MHLLMAVSGGNRLDFELYEFWKYLRNLKIKISDKF